jgi:hypothetical protein
MKIQICNNCLGNAEGQHSCKRCKLEWCNECEDSKILTFSGATMTVTDRYPGAETPRMQHEIDAHVWVD